MHTHVHMHAHTCAHTYTQTHNHKDTELQVTRAKVKLKRVCCVDELGVPEPYILDSSHQPHFVTVCYNVSFFLSP